MIHRYKMEKETITNVKIDIKGGFISAWKRIKADRDLKTVKRLVPRGYCWTSDKVYVGWTCHSMADVRATLRAFALEGYLLKTHIKNEQAPSWILKGKYVDIQLTPSWTTSEGATCRLVQVGEETNTYPKYKLVCEDKENG